jgi:hypothetical protein
MASRKTFSEVSFSLLGEKVSAKPTDEGARRLAGKGDRHRDGGFEHHRPLIRPATRAVFSPKREKETVAA